MRRRALTSGVATGRMDASGGSVVGSGGISRGVVAGVGDGDGLAGVGFLVVVAVEGGGGGVSRAEDDSCVPFCAGGGAYFGALAPKKERIELWTGLLVGRDMAFVGVSGDSRGEEAHTLEIVGEELFRNKTRKGHDGKESPETDSRFCFDSRTKTRSYIELCLTCGVALLAGKLKGGLKYGLRFWRAIVKRAAPRKAKKARYACAKLRYRLPGVAVDLIPNVIRRRHSGMDCNPDSGLQALCGGLVVVNRWVAVETCRGGS